MAMTPYNGDPNVIAKLGTTPQERGLTTEQFKAKFDEGLKAFVEWFNATHKTDFDAVQTELTSHKAEITSSPEEIIVTSGFASGWSGEIRYRKSKTNIVSVSILLTKETDIEGGATTLYTLPVGFRPPANNRVTKIFTPLTLNNGLTNTLFRIYILETGVIQIYPVGGTTFLNARRINQEDFIYQV